MVKGHYLPVNCEQCLHLCVGKAFIGRKLGQGWGYGHTGGKFAPYKQKIATTAKSLGQIEQIAARKVPFSRLNLREK